MLVSEYKHCAVVVAHPDDETLWCGGMILMHPQSNWRIVTLCRKGDPDRAPKFFRVMEQLGTVGAMGDLDDGPEQTPLNEVQVQDTIAGLLGLNEFDLIITHGEKGEYSRHRRHEQTGDAVVALCKSGRLRARQVWRFAYEDGGGRYLPRAIMTADMVTELPDNVWRRKYDIITGTYGFGADSFEARTSPRVEAFRILNRDDITKGR